MDRSKMQAEKPSAEGEKLYLGQTDTAATIQEKAGPRVGLG